MVRWCIQMTHLTLVCEVIWELKPEVRTFVRFKGEEEGVKQHVVRFDRLLRTLAMAPKKVFLIHKFRDFKGRSAGTFRLKSPPPPPPSLSLSFTHCENFLDLLKDRNALDETQRKFDRTKRHTAGLKPEMSQHSPRSHHFCGGEFS